MLRVVAVGAHPDDETAFAGGIIARYASEGADVRIVCVTRGEGGEAGDPALSSLEELGATRERELRCAAAALGASGVQFLGFVDPRIAVGEEGRPIDATLEEFAKVIDGILEDLRPDLVLTHGSTGEYGHPQHVFTNQAVRVALARYPAPRPELLTWCAMEEGQPEDRFTNVDDKADLVVDVTPWFEAKCSAMACHQTQLAMIYRNSKVTDLREIVRKVERFRRWESL